jgi:hypothetical protein
VIHVKVQALMDQRKLLDEGSKAFQRDLGFSEYDAICLLRPYIQSSIKLESLEVISVKDALAKVESGAEAEGWAKEKIEAAEPGYPGLQFWNVGA